MTSLKITNVNWFHKVTYNSVCRNVTVLISTQLLAVPSVIKYSDLAWFRMFWTGIPCSYCLMNRCKCYSTTHKLIFHCRMYASFSSWRSSFLDSDTDSSFCHRLTLREVASGVPGFEASELHLHFAEQTTAGRAQKSIIIINVESLSLWGSKRGKKCTHLISIKM